MSRKNFAKNGHRVLPKRSVHAQEGASLIEVLVAVVLLSFGIVGLAGLQFNGTKFNHSAYLRSQATSLAYDLVDRARANLNACPVGGACAYATPLATAFNGNAAQACGRPIAAANANAMAAIDVNQWKSCLENLLPGARGRVVLLGSAAGYVDQCGITHAAAGRQVLVVEVNWTDGRVAGGANRDCVVIRTEVRPLS
ncbi:type IV pilus modification protein PilV [Hydrogenophaga sp.]|uniref:type IV pilus modification protein PilV n=1 Tax=Hydrogenophaga sp. TaxID=1904254 RepID=UPI003F6AC3CD